jgi:hypothetical protein
MPRLELTFLYLASGGGCNARGRGSANPRPEPSRLRAVRRYGHSESPANLLIHVRSYSASYSECALISLKVLPDFDSTIRRFESSRPSQAFRQLARHPGKREIGPEIPAFRGLVSVSRLPIPQFWGATCRKSPATSANIPVLRRFWAETGFDLYCVGHRAVLSDRLLEPFVREIGNCRSSTA